MTDENKSETHAKVEAEAGNPIKPESTVKVTKNKDPYPCPAGFPKEKWDCKGDGFKRGYMKAIGGK